MKNNIDEQLLLQERVDINSEIPILEQVLRIAVYNEFKAYETYSKILEKFGSIDTFIHIKEAEARHYSILIPLLQKYEIEIPINNWSDKIEVPNSLIECYEIAVASEINNISMYDNLISHTNEADVKDILFQLQAASYNNHLPAFRVCVQNYYSSNNQSEINEQNMMEKITEYQNLFTSLSRGELDESKISEIFSKINFSMLGGTVFGGATIALLTNYLNKTKE